MKYVIDSSSIIDLFRWYNQTLFPTLWQYFRELVSREEITSVVQALEELKRGSEGDSARQWALLQESLFETPSSIEMGFFQDVYKISKFRGAIPMDITSNDAKADVFLIARANTVGGMVITQEKYKSHGDKIPNICEHFDIPCGTLEDMMLSEGWSF